MNTPTTPAERLWGCARCQVTWRDVSGTCWICGTRGVNHWYVTTGSDWTAAQTVTHAVFTPTETWHE